MSSSYLYTNFEINFGNPMRQFSDLTNDIQAWHDLIDLLDQVNIQTPQGSVTLKLDWGNAKQFISEIDKRTISMDDFRNVVASAESKIEQGNAFKDYLEKKMNEYYTLTQKELVVGCSIINPPLNDNRDNVNYMIYFLHSIYLAMNLASPGSCNLSDIKIMMNDKQQELFKNSLFLAGNSLESAALLANQLQWPPLESIPVQKTWKWTQVFSAKSFSRSNVERAIFALMHTCTERNYINPADFVWLAHALEALFDTPEQGISKALRDRVFLVLGNPTANHKKIKKMLTDFYNLRSAFVHGDSEIPNPMHHESILEEDDRYDQGSKHIEFAMLIVIATLQKMIVNDWHSIKFSEQYSGILNDNK